MIDPTTILELLDGFSKYHMLKVSSKDLDEYFEEIRHLSMFDELSEYLSEATGVNYTSQFIFTIDAETKDEYIGKLMQVYSEQQPVE